MHTSTENINDVDRVKDMEGMIVRKHVDFYDIIYIHMYLYASPALILTLRTSHIQDL